MNKTERLALVKHVAIYLRISDEKKVKGKRISVEETLQNHKQRLTDFCKNKNYTFEIFQEIVSGGKQDIGERPELNKLLKRLTEFDAIVVNEITRLSRDTFISGLIHQKMVTFDKLLLTPEHTYYLKDGNDALMYGINSVISQHEREVIGKRIKFNKLEMARQGLNASGAAPIGYKRNPDTKKLEIDAATAHIPATAFYLNLLGYGSMKIRDILNNLGFKTGTGAFWTNETVRELLNRQTYKGYTVYNDYETITTIENGEEKKKRIKKDTIVIPNTHEPIISPEKFDQLTINRTDRSKNKTRNKSTKEEPSILKDLLFCKCCGRKKKLAYEKKKKSWLIRGCSITAILSDGSRCYDAGMKAEPAEDQILQTLLKKKAAFEAEVDLLLKSDHKNLDQENLKHKERLDKELKAKEKELEELALIRVNLMLEKNEVMEKAIQTKMNDNEAAQNTIRMQLEKINESIAAPKAEEEIKKRLEVIDIIKNIEKETDNEKINNFMKRIINKIHYTRTIPAEIAKLGTKHPSREKIKALLEIEYI